MIFVEALAGLALLIGGAEMLVRGAVALSLRMGMSTLVVGLTVVSFGTSAPELVVSLTAASSGANDIAIGNVVGSNICNVALILGLSSLVTPLAVEAKIVRLDAPLMIAASLLLMVMLADDSVSRIEGACLLAGLVAYTASTLLLAKRESDFVRDEFAHSAASVPATVRTSVLLVAGGVIALVGGGRLLVSVAVDFATAVGVSQAAIGLTVVAVGTSLPELATSVVAAARGQGDIAVGNVVGSNLFNILGILGTAAAVAPLPRGEIGWTDLGVMVATGLVVLPLLHTRLRLVRSEGVVLLTCYVGYVFWQLSAAGF